MIWTQDPGDYSWFAKDSIGYFYRVQKVVSESGSRVWVCAWSESSGFRIGSYSWPTEQDAKDRMNWIASTDEGSSAVSSQDRVHDES